MRIAPSHREESVDWNPQTPRKGDRSRTWYSKEASSSHSWCSGAVSLVPRENATYTLKFIPAFNAELLSSCGIQTVVGGEQSQNDASQDAPRIVPVLSCLN
jgi:hypothetical protein